MYRSHPLQSSDGPETTVYQVHLGVKTVNDRDLFTRSQRTRHFTHIYWLGWRVLITLPTYSVTYTLSRVVFTSFFTDHNSNRDDTPDSTFIHTFLPQFVHPRDEYFEFLHAKRCQPSETQGIVTNHVSSTSQMYQWTYNLPLVSVTTTQEKGDIFINYLLGISGILS